jgi:hypothetical protein
MERKRRGMGAMERFRSFIRRWRGRAEVDLTLAIGSELLGVDMGTIKAAEGSPRVLSGGEGREGASAGTAGGGKRW